MVWCSSKKFSEESDEKEPVAGRERDRAIGHDATPHRSAPSRAQTPRDQASPYHPGRTHSYKKRNKTKTQKKKKVSVY
jgi:hypothetical protein